MRTESGDPKKVFIGDTDDDAAAEMRNQNSE